MPCVDGCVDEASLATGAVTTAKIADGNVTDVKLASTPTDAATGGTLVKRDVNGDFAAGTLDLGGNLVLANSTSSTVGNILKGADRFLHNTGPSNTFLGVDAGNFGVSGDGNTALGSEAGSSLTSGGANTLVGRSAGRDFTTGRFNTVVGSQALQSGTGDGNTAVGLGAMLEFDGSNNTAVGRNALGNVLGQTGLRNVAIGDGAGHGLQSGDDNIYIANSGQSESSTIRIGDADQTRTFIAGIRDVTTGVADAIGVLIASDGQLGTVSSSARYKHDIADLGDRTEALHALRPVSFRYLPDMDASQTLTYGLIAEEVAEVMPGLVVYDESGRPETVKYRLLAPLLLNEVQRLARENDELRARIERLEALVTGGRR